MAATITAIAPELREKVCTSCDESWPADSEFFFSGGRGRLMSECKACYNGSRRPPKQSESGVLTRILQGLYASQASNEDAHG